MDGTRGAASISQILRGDHDIELLVMLSLVAQVPASCYHPPSIGETDIKPLTLSAHGTRV